MTLDERIARYLDKIPGAVSGSDGHGQTFTVACALVNGFALDTDAALRHLTTYNATCSPPWSPRELRHKVIQAEKTAHSKPRGYLLGNDPASRPEAVQSAAKPVPVRLEPKNRRFGTLGTLTRNPYGHTRGEEMPYAYRSVGAFASSRASQDENQEAHSMSMQIHIDPPADTSLGIPIDPSPDWTAINAKCPPTDEEKNWQAVVDAGFGDEPLILSAFTLFGPGCRVLSPEETTV